MCCILTIITLVFATSTMQNGALGPSPTLIPPPHPNHPPTPPPRVSWSSIRSDAASGMHTIAVTYLSPPPPLTPPPALPPPPPAKPIPAPPPTPRHPLPRPPPMPLQPPPALPLVDRMNARFRHRGTGLTGALLCHTMDGFEDSLSDRITAAWLRKGTHLDLSRLSASYLGGGGMILNPATAVILCAYGGNSDALLSSRIKTCASDGSSWVRPGEACRPGCAPVVRHSVREDDATWCEPSRARDDWCAGLPWQPEHLRTMVDQRLPTSNRTELVVLDGPHFLAAQPRSVDAIFAVTTDPDGGAAARQLHLGFLAAFPEVGYRDFPLLLYDPVDKETPFSVATAPELTSPRPHTTGSVLASVGLGGASSPPRPPPPPGGHGATLDPCEDARDGDYVNLACRGYGRR